MPAPLPAPAPPAAAAVADEAVATAGVAAGEAAAGRMARCICRGERDRGGCMAVRCIKGRAGGCGSVVWTAGRHNAVWREDSAGALPPAHRPSAPAETAPPETVDPKGRNPLPLEGRSGGPPHGRATAVPRSWPEAAAVPRSGREGAAVVRLVGRTACCGSMEVAHRCVAVRPAHCQVFFNLCRTQNREPRRTRCAGRVVAKQDKRQTPNLTAPE